MFAPRARAHRLHDWGEFAYIGVFPPTLLRNFISFYHQAYRAAVWRSRHNFHYICG
jgi:hypothetical protein